MALNSRPRLTEQGEIAGGFPILGRASLKHPLRLVPLSFSISCDLCTIKGSPFQIPIHLLSLLIYCATNFSLCAFSNFLPVLVKSFGFSTVDTNLLTVPIWVFAAVCILVTGVVSDGRKERGWLLVLCFVLAYVGYIILLARPPSRWVQFVAVMFVGGGTFPQVTLVQSWMTSNMIGYTKRSVPKNTSGRGTLSFFLSFLP